MDGCQVEILEKIGQEICPTGIELVNFEVVSQVPGLIIFGFGFMLICLLLFLVYWRN